MKTIIMAVLLMAFCSFGAELTDANEPPDRDDMVREQILALDDRIDTFERDPNSIVEQKLKRTRKHLDDRSLGDDMRFLLTMFESVLVERADAWVDHRIERLNVRKADLERDIEERR